MSERPNEEKHALISEHLTFCSTCFNRYMYGWIVCARCFVRRTKPIPMKHSLV
jgi:hypothetical protein